MAKLPNLLRVSKVDETVSFPLRKSTCYKWIHLHKHPELFVKIGGTQYINLDRLDEVIRKGGTK